MLLLSRTMLLLSRTMLLLSIENREGGGNVNIRGGPHFAALLPSTGD